jgi:hypothetical protein
MRGMGVRERERLKAGRREDVGRGEDRLAAQLADAGGTMKQGVAVARDRSRIPVRPTPGSAGALPAF